MSMRVGTDLVSVDVVRQSIRVHAEHYLKRVYTQRELDDCLTPQGIDPERLAGRFAAKEATLKVLRPRDEAVPLNTIEVCRDPSGWIELELSGPAAALASAGDLEEFSLSIAHESGFATAVVIARCS